MTHRDDVVAFLTAATLSRVEVDRFLDPEVPAWARFDPELGYLPNDARVPDNVDGAVSEYRYGPWGERLQVNHPDRTARINTYGDSFTQCHQVSDGQTWQEVLAAHFLEPIRNFGVGGFGVFQAVRRLWRVEGTEASAPNILLNIYFDDHYRNLDAYRLLRLGKWWREYDLSLPTSMFHANPWTHVRIDPATGVVTVRDNPCPTPESLYDLCDTDFMVECFGDDLVVEKLVADQTGDYGYVARYEDLSGALGVRLEPGGDHRAAAHALWERSAFSATAQILGELRRDLESAGKRLLVLLTYPGSAVAEFLAGGRRPDAPVLESLRNLGIPFVDGLRLHADDYHSFSLSPQSYVDRYYTDHYTPLGNVNFAFMIKDRLVDWLHPAPPAYRHLDR